MWRSAVVVAGLVLGVGAMAQEPTFELDSLLVPTFAVEPAELRPEADRLRERIERLVGEQHVVLQLGDVPEFTAFGADIYMQSCPPGRYVECALLLGVRGGVEWSIGGEVSAVDGGLRVKLTLIDVAAARVAQQIEVIYGAGGSADADADQALLDVLELALAGTLDAFDVRVEEEVPDVEAEAEDVYAQQRELDDAEASDGEVDRSTGPGSGRARLDAEDLTDYDDMEGGTPWERAHMRRGEYLRFRNSGVTVERWRERQQGRFAQILVSASLVTVGQGPWTQTYDGWYALESTNLEVVETLALLDQQPGLDRSWEIGLAGGVLPWMEVGVFGGPRLSTFRYRVQRVVEDDDTRLREYDHQVINTWQVGGRLGVMPLPTYMIRPTIHAGVAYWAGTRQDKVLDVSSYGIEPVGRNWMLLLHTALGFEVDVGRHIVLWGKAIVEVPVAGRVAQQVDNTGFLLVDHPTADTTDDGIQVAGSVGATVRIRLLKKR
jgi:hypothetical protein